MREAWVTRKTIRKDFRQAPKDADFEIKTGKDVLKLSLLVGVVSEDRVPDGAAYLLYARLT